MEKGKCWKFASRKLGMESARVELRGLVDNETDALDLTDVVKANNPDECVGVVLLGLLNLLNHLSSIGEIGRASCRERV